MRGAVKDRSGDGVLVMSLKAKLKEVCELAKRLGLTGFCRNLENGDVMAQLQGSENKITYLISFMETLKRIKIENKVIEELEVDEKETEFLKQ